MIARAARRTGLEMFRRDAVGSTGQGKYWVIDTM
jgi:hypothetical protein